MDDYDESFEDEVIQEISRAVATLSPMLRDLAAEHEPFILHSAAAAGEVELVHALLDAGLSPDAYPGTEDEDDEPPLVWIARHRDRSSNDGLAVAALLIERGAGLDEGMPLRAALEKGDVPFARLLILAGADTQLVVEDAGVGTETLLRSLLSEIQLQDMDTRA